MKRTVFAAFLFVCAGLLAFGFARGLYIDFSRHYEFGSSPLWLYIAARFIEFLLPAAGCLTGGLAVLKKGKGRK